jgi:hypothetical protein
MKDVYIARFASGGQGALFVKTAPWTPAKTFQKGAYEPSGRPPYQSPTNQVTTFEIDMN